MESVWGMVIRGGQAAIEGSSTLVAGFFIAAVLRVMVGMAGTRRLFGGEGLGGLFRAWVIGSLLPVCSLGVIPIARELRRAGVPSATVLAFVLAAPQLNPLSFLYGLTLSDPIVIISFVLATMILAILGGEIWKRVFETPADRHDSAEEPTPAPGVKRLLAVVVAAARDCVSPTSAYVLIGIGFTGLLAGLLPHGSLANSMRHDNPLSPVLMMLIGLPAYSGVLPGMMRIGLIFEHGNSVGAAFVLFDIGVGLNLGLLAWLLTTYGAKRILAWLAVMLAIVLALAFAIEQPLYFAAEEADHTHAFDDWTCPLLGGLTSGWDEAIEKWRQKVEVLEPVALAILGGLFILGWVLQVGDGGGRVDAWLRAPPRPSTGRKPWWNRDVPAPVLGMAALAGLVVFSVVALYIYYPATEQALDEMARLRADAILAVRTGHKDEAIRRLEQWDLLTRKLQVGVFLRTGRMDPQARQEAEGLRERLEAVRDALLAGEAAEAVERLGPLEATYRTLRDRYRPSPGRLGR